jgi:hypothetical protein
MPFFDLVSRSSRKPEDYVAFQVRATQLHYILNPHDSSVLELSCKASRILARLIAGGISVPQESLTFFVNWLRELIRLPVSIASHLHGLVSWRCCSSLTAWYSATINEGESSLIYLNLM